MSFYEKIEENFHIEICNYKTWPKLSDAHFHNCYELYYLLNGSIRYLIGNEIFSINQFDMIWIPSGILHKTRPDTKESFKRILIYVNNEYIDEFEKSDKSLKDFFSKTNIIRFDESERNNLNLILEKLLNEFSGESEPNLLLIKSYLGILFVLLKQNCIKAGTEDYDINSDNVPEKLKGILYYINNNFFNELSLDILSKEFFLHPVYISTMLKKGLGITYIEYLNKVRIQKSIKMLKLEKYKITEIALSCGFNSSNHYCKTFKAYMNISPDKYRKELHKTDT